MQDYINIFTRDEAFPYACIDHLLKQGKTIQSVEIFHESRAADLLLQTGIYYILTELKVFIRENNVSGRWLSFRGPDLELVSLNRGTAAHDTGAPEDYDETLGVFCNIFCRDLVRSTAGAKWTANGYKVLIYTDPEAEQLLINDSDQFLINDFDYLNIR